MSYPSYVANDFVWLSGWSVPRDRFRVCKTRYVSSKGRRVSSGSLLHRFSCKNIGKRVKSDTFRDNKGRGGRGSCDIFSETRHISFLRPETVPNLLGRGRGSEILENSDSSETGRSGIYNDHARKTKRQLSTIIYRD